MDEFRSLDYMMDTEGTHPRSVAIESDDLNIYATRKSALALPSGLSGLFGPSPSMQFSSKIESSSSGFHTPSFVPPSFATSSSSKIMSAMPFATAAPRTLKQIPIFYEKYSSFYTCDRASDVLDTMDKFFQSLEHVDHEPNRLKNKMKGITRAGSGRACFVVKIYQAADPNERLVEFQRREGCTVAFNQMLSHARSALGSRVLRSGTGVPYSTPAQPRAFPFPFPSLGSEPVEPHFEPHIEQNLFDLAQSEYADVQRQALGVLANTSSTQPSKMVEILQKVLSSSDCVIQENACRCLVNICNDQTARGTVAQALLSDILDLLCHTPGSLENRSSKRDVAKALELLSQTHADQIKQFLLKEENKHTSSKLNDFAKSNGSYASSVARTLDALSAVQVA